MENLHNIIIIGVSIMIMLALGVVFFVILYQRRMLLHQVELKKMNEQKQQELLQASIRGEEEERMRIASELHDDVGATLSSIGLFLHAAAKNSDKEMIAHSRHLLSDSIQKIRGISHKLQPSILNDLGLKTSLEALVETINKSGSFQVSHDIVTLPFFDESTSLAIYRVIQELLNNVIKHSQATAIHLTSTVTQDHIVMILSHDGNGLTNETYNELIYKKGAIGLKNIVNRIKSINASISFGKKAQEFYKVNIVIPYNNNLWQSSNTSLPTITKSSDKG